MSVEVVEKLIKSAAREERRSEYLGFRDLTSAQKSKTILDEMMRGGHTAMQKEIKYVYEFKERVPVQAATKKLRGDVPVA